MANHPPRSDMPGWPRAMPAHLACRYVSVSLEVLRRDGPKPSRLASRPLWLKDDLDAWLDRVFGRAPSEPEFNPWD